MIADDYIEDRSMYAEAKAQDFDPRPLLYDLSAHGYSPESVGSGSQEGDAFTGAHKDRAKDTTRWEPKHIPTTIRLADDPDRLQTMHPVHLPPVENSNRLNTP